MTQSDVTKLGATAAELNDSLKALSQQWRGKDMPENVKQEVLDMDGALARANARFNEANDQLRAEEKSLATGVNGTVNPLATPGVYGGVRASEVEGSIENFDNYYKNYHGRLQNFKENVYGRSAAEMLGSFALALFNPNDTIRADAEKTLKTKFRIGDIRNPKGLSHRDLTSTVDSSGGVLVPTTLESAIIILRELTGIVPRFAQNVPMGAGTTKFPRRHQGTQFFWEGETIPLTFDEQLALNMVALTAKLGTSLIAFSNQLNQDAVISLGDYIAGEFAYSQAYALDDATFNGDGTLPYGGILGYNTLFQQNRLDTGGANPGLYTSLQAGSATDWNKIDKNDITNWLSKLSLFTDDLSRVKIFTSFAGYNQIFERLLTSGGGNTNITLAQGDSTKMVYGRNFLGYEIIPVQVLPRAATDAGIIMYAGDMGMSTMFGVRRELEIAASPVAGNAFVTNSTYMRGLFRGTVVNHSVGLDTVDKKGNPISGGMVAFKTLA